ncbi:MAG: serine/threonine protein kinase [Deltaproteobacteria bacterium]|nr:serine/threonine protein kinase [Deltaproteobacteria bacterium]
MKDAVSSCNVKDKAFVATSDDLSDFAAGTVLGGSYRLIRRLGRGGMGDIHLASHERLPGQFVVKVLNPDLVSDQDAFVRFRQEAVVMANIRHPNVVQLVDFNFTMAGLPFLVMEHLPGKDLAEILTTRPFLAAAQVSSIVRQVACALDAAHKLGIVHRDLKPENIMVVPCEGQGDLIKVIDFGISKARRFNHVTAASMVMGTPEFMSPEQAQGRQQDVDPRSDQFALAVISYLLLTGRTPWGATAPIEILHRVVNNDPLPMTHDDAWRAVESVLARGLAKEPRARFPSTLAFWRALDRAMLSDGVLTSATGHSTTIHGPAMEMQRTRRERNLPSAVVPPASDTPAIIPLSEVRTDVAVADVAVADVDGADGAVEDRLLGAVGGPAAKAEFALGRDEDAERDGPLTTRFPRTKDRRRRKSGQLAWQGAVLLLVLAGGFYLGMQDVRVLRSRADGNWSAFRTFAARTVERGISQGHRILNGGKAAKTANPYLSVETPVAGK